MIKILLLTLSAWGAGSLDFPDMPSVRSEQQPGNFEIIDRWPYGPGFSIDIDDDILFYANGAVLQIGEINPGNQVTWLSEVIFPGLAYTMVISGDRLYVAVDDQGIAIVDVASLNTPVVINQFQTPGRVFGLAVRGDTVFASMGEEGLAVYDCFDAVNPELIESVGGTNLRRLRLAGNLLYMTDRIRGLRILDVSNPAELREVAEISLPGQHEGIALDTVRNKAWVCSFDQGVNLVDISDSSQPVLVGGLPVFVAWAVSLDTANAYIVTWNDSLSVIDLDSYEEIGGLDMDTLGGSGIWAYDVDSDGSRIAVSGYLGAWWLADFEDVGNPVVSDGEARGGIAQEISVGEDWIILGLQGGRLAFFPRTGKANPVRIQKVPDWVQDLSIRSDTLFTALSWAGFASYLLPESEQDSAQVMSHLVFDHLFVEGFALSSSHAFLAARDSGIVVVDISDPYDFREVGRLNLGGRVMSVVLAGNVLYAGLDGGGIWELDVSIPSQPTAVKLHPTDGSVIGIELTGDLLIAVQGNAGTALYDISSADWQFASSVPSGNVTFSVCVDEEILFLADGSAGVSTYSIEDPYSPQFLSSMNTGGSVRDLACFADTLALADGYDGLMIVCYITNHIGEQKPRPLDVSVINPLFTCELNFNQPVEAFLFDSAGRSITKITGSTYDGTNLKPGIYFCKGRDWCLKVIKIR